MKVTLCCEDGRSAVVEVDPSTELATIKLLAEVELGLPSGSLQVLHNGSPIADSVATLGAAGVNDDDLLFLQAPRPGPPQPSASHQAPAVAAAAAAAPAPQQPQQRQFTMAELESQDPKILLAFFKANPQQLRALHHHDPTLADAIESGDEAKIRMTVMMAQMNNHKHRWTREQTLRRMEEDPDNVENQARVEEMIRQQVIDRSYARAMEETPEVFGRVTMLYIDAAANGHNIKAFVDSGAQSTIMSLECARKSNLEHLIDTRFKGEARGVGTAKILGRVHIAPLEIGGVTFDCCFTILERNDIEFLFGLDMLRRHQCSINLKDGCLHIGSGNVTVPFLSEKDLPAHARDGHVPPAVAAAAGQGGTVGGTTPSLPPSAAAAAAAEARAAGAAAPPPAGTDGSTAGASASAAPSGGGYAAKVRQLTALGFSAQQAAAALASTNGDVDQAAAMLVMQFT